MSVSCLAGLRALLLAALPLLAAGAAGAADFDRLYPPPGPGYGAEAPPLPPREPAFRAPPRLAPPRFTGAGPEACREFVRRRLDADGEPVMRRVRVCDEPALDRGPPAEEGPAPRRWGGPGWDGPRWDRPHWDRPHWDGPRW